jgi:hypothetical protein
MRHAPAALLTAALLSTSFLCAAEPLKREEVPTPLKDWVGWVLRGHEGELCSLSRGTGARACAWPGTLKLALTDAGGTFEQSWRMETEDWVALPGGAERWPQDVKVDGAAVPVVERSGAPSIRLKPGARRVTGAFKWSRVPDQLEIPAEIGMLTLNLHGSEVKLPLRDDANRLWMQTKTRVVAPREGAALALTVHRRLIDDVPLTLVTRVQLKVSGADRELVLGRALPEGFSALSLVSPLPARLDSDGRLRVQARSGTWDVLLTARRETPGADIKLPAPNGPWAEDEAWVFDARPALRQAEVEGAASLDPQQTELYPEWKTLPAYLVKPGGSLKLVERRRGDEPPEADRLTLERNLWLDFDGRGFSARDHLSGRLGKSWRLESSPETVLGRVSSGGADQFLTALTPGGAAGLEVRTRDIDITADSRIEGRRLTASGWKHDFESVSAVINLPPGWRLVHVFGADSARPTWVSSWTLLDFFLVLVAAAAITRLYGRVWGAVGLVGLALLWHEAGAPRWLWLAVLLLAALDRALPPELSFVRWVRFGRKAALVLLALVALPFFLTQIRHGAFPVLEYPYNSITPRDADVIESNGDDRMLHSALASSERGDRRAARLEAKKAAAQVAEEQQDEDADESDNMAEAGAAGGMQATMSLPTPAPAASFAVGGKMRMKVSAPSYYSEVMTQMRLDPNSRVNTGPGLPYWSWNQARVSWRGPVPQGSALRFWLLSPCENFFLALARVLLTILLGLLLADLPVGDWLKSLTAPEGRAKVLKTLLPLALLALVGVNAAAQDRGFPPKNLLDDLKARLTEAPSCAPNCAESPRLQLKASGEWLSMTLTVHAAAPSAVPIPTGGHDWTPVRGTLDGQTLSVRREGDGSLWAPVPAGAHELVLEGPLPQTDAVQLSLPMKPRRVDATLSGWNLHGIRENGRPEDNLQLSRARGAEPAAAAAATARAQGTFPPFLRVERTVRLGLTWTVETRVTRLTPLGTPVVVQIPLLPGESITSSDLRASDGKLSVSLPPQSPSTEWTSVLPESKALELNATTGKPWTEVWRVEPGPLWHISASGIPPAFAQDASGPRTLEYHPWPGEALKVAVSRPGSVVGQTMTIDQSVLHLTPGLRQTDATLSVRLRTSRGDRQTFILPEGAELLAARVDGRQQPLRLEGRKLVVAVAPGSHLVEADWRQPGGAKIFLRAPEVDLGVASVNSHVEIAVPAGRWTLFLGGRGVGPVVLFWSMLAVFALAALGLAKTGLTPLDWRRWLLLAIGLSQLSVPGAALVAGWFVAMGERGRHAPTSRRSFNFVQVALAFYAALAAALLFKAIAHGLLGAPDMQIAGNGSHGGLLRWYTDRSSTMISRPWVFSVPLGVYRGAMLLWALWLADSVLNWARWAWTQYGVGGLWRKD